MPNRKHRRSAVAMMIVAGGLAAAVAAPIDPTLAQEADAQQGTTSVQCNGFLPVDFLVVGTKLYLIGKDGSKTEAADGRWKTNGGGVFIVENGIIISQ